MNKKRIEKIQKQINEKLDKCKRWDRPKDILNAEEWEVYCQQFKGGPDRTYPLDWALECR